MAKPMHAGVYQLAHDATRSEMAEWFSDWGARHHQISVLDGLFSKIQSHLQVNCGETRTINFLEIQ